MDDSASREEIEWCRNYFKSANMDVFEIINKAIDVAAHDHPHQLRFQRYRIAQRLFSGSLSSSTWNFPPPLEISDENSVIHNPPVPEIDQDHHDASNPNAEARPRLILRIKTKRNNNEEEQVAEGQSSVKSRVKGKDDRSSKKRAVKKASSRKDRKSCEYGVAKSSLLAKKRKLCGEAEVLQGGNGEQVPTTSIQKITKIRFVHGFH